MALDGAEIQVLSGDFCVNLGKVIDGGLGLGGAAAAGGEVGRTSARSTSSVGGFLWGRGGSHGGLDGGHTTGRLNGRVRGQVGHGDDEATDVEVGRHLVNDADSKVQVGRSVEHETRVGSGLCGNDGITEEGVDGAERERNQKFWEISGVQGANAVDDDATHKVGNYEANHEQKDVSVVGDDVGLDVLPDGS